MSDIASMEVVAVAGDNLGWIVAVVGALVSAKPLWDWLKQRDRARVGAEAEKLRLEAAQVASAQEMVSRDQSRAESILREHVKALQTQIDKLEARMTTMETAALDHAAERAVHLSTIARLEAQMVERNREVKRYRGLAARAIKIGGDRTDYMCSELSEEDV